MLDSYGALRAIPQFKTASRMALRARHGSVYCRTPVIASIRAVLVGFRRQPGREGGGDRLRGDEPLTPVRPRRLNHQHPSRAERVPADKFGLADYVFVVRDHDAIEGSPRRAHPFSALDYRIR